MIIKWTRESLLVLLTLLMILVALFYYGNRLLVEPFRVSADVSSQTVSDQELLLNQYPPSDELFSETENDYNETVRFIPQGETINEALMLLNDAAESSDVSLNQISRLADEQGVEELDSRYARSTYQIELESDEAVNIRRMLDDLNAQDRLWNIRVLNYQQESNETVSGSFILDLYYQTSDEN